MAACRLCGVFAQSAAPSQLAAVLDPLSSRLLQLLRDSEPERVRVAAAACVCAVVEVCGSPAAVATGAPPSLRRGGAQLLSRAVQLLLAHPGGEGVRSAAARVAAAGAGGGCASALKAHAPALRALALHVLHATGSAQLVGRLPRVGGDAAGWTAAAAELLQAAHAALDGAGAPPRHGRALPSGGGSECAPCECVSTASRSLDGLCAMLRTPFPVAVPLPAVEGVACARRALGWHGAGAGAATRLRLPLLHASAARLLSHLLKAGGAAACFPVRAAVCDALAALLRATSPHDEGGGGGGAPCPPLRVTAYEAVGDALAVLGASSCVALCAPLTEAARLDMRHPATGGTAAPTPHAGGGGGGGRKRKASGQAFEGNDAAPAAHASTTEVRTAALCALSTLLVVGGGCCDDLSRDEVDGLCAAAAARSATFATPDAERLASLEALRASVVSPRLRRAPHLASAAALFGRGLAGRDGLACARALADLEPLLHPTAAPVAMAALDAPPARGHERDAHAWDAPLTAGGASQPGDLTKGDHLFAQPQRPAGGDAGAAHQASATPAVGGLQHAHVPQQQQQQQQQPDVHVSKPLVAPVPTPQLAPVPSLVRGSVAPGPEPDVVPPRATPAFAVQPETSAKPATRADRVAAPLPLLEPQGDSDSEGPLPEIVDDE